MFFQLSSGIVILLNHGKNTKISMILSDEEESKESKESKEFKGFKAEFLLHTEQELVLVPKIFTPKVTTFYLLKEYHTNYNVFLPPPELV